MRERRRRQKRPLPSVNRMTRKGSNEQNKQIILLEIYTFVYCERRFVFVSFWIRCISAQWKRSGLCCSEQVWSLKNKLPSHWPRLLDEGTKVKLPLLVNVIVKRTLLLQEIDFSNKAKKCRVTYIFWSLFLRVPYLAVACTFEKIEEDSGRYEALFCSVYVF